MTEMQNYADLLVNQGVALTSNPVVQKHPRRGEIRITSQQLIARSGTITDLAFASIEEYRASLEVQDYLVVLADGSLIQLSYDFAGNELTRHRLCFRPCPYEVDPSDFESESILDVIDLYQDEAPELLRLRSPLRFDFDADCEDDDHSASHVHMLWAHCRCAVSGPISIGRFSSFVFRHFYPILWREHSFLRSMRQARWDRSIRPQDEEFLHLSWRDRLAS